MVSGDSGDSPHAAHNSPHAWSSWSRAARQSFFCCCDSASRCSSRVTSAMIPSRRATSSAFSWRSSAKRSASATSCSYWSGSEAAVSPTQALTSPSSDCPSMYVFLIRCHPSSRRATLPRQGTAVGHMLLGIELQSSFLILASSWSACFRSRSAWRRAFVASVKS